MNPQRSSLYPGESRRVVDKLATAAVKIEEMLYAPGLCITRHFHDTANLVYIIAGVHWSGYSRRGDTCVPNTVRFLPPGEVHENYFPVASRCLQIELHPSILDLAAEHSRTICSAGELTQPRAIFLGRRLHREFRKKDSDSLLDIEEIILRLLLSDEESSTKREGAPSWLLQIREMLYDEPTSHRSLLDLSRRVARHPVQISRQFRQYFGCTISEYMRRLRVARAQFLLSCPEMEISEIALACGFCDQSHFTTVFRRLTGMPPHRYRGTHYRGKPAMQRPSHDELPRT